MGIGTTYQEVVVAIVHHGDRLRAVKRLAECRQGAVTRVTRTTRAVGCNGQPECVVRRARCKVVSCEMLGWGRKGEQQAETRQGRLVAVMWFNQF